MLAMIYLNAQANKSTCKLVDSSTNKKGYLAFHAPPFGGGEGGRGQLLQLLQLLLEDGIILEQIGF